MPEKRVHVTKTQKELNELDDDSTDIYKSNIIEPYSLRPNTIPAVDKLCLAQFAALHYKDYRTDYNETKEPDVLNEDLLELQNSTGDMEQSLPCKTKLMNKNEHMKCRKVNLFYGITCLTKEKSRVIIPPFAYAVFTMAKRNRPSKL